MIGIIPAAGYGLRFKELGENYPKAILPYRERPIIINQIEWLVAQGASLVRLVISQKHYDSLINILEFYKIEIPVEIFIQKNQNGLSGAIYEALKNDKADFDERIIVVLGDILPSDPLTLRVKLSGNWVSIQQVKDWRRWCMAIKSDDELTALVDKPLERPNSNHALSGIYLLNSSKLTRYFIEIQLNSNEKIENEFQFSTVLTSILKEQPINCFEAELIDFGTLDEYLRNRGIRNSRSFNNVSIVNDIVIKESHSNGSKLIDEWNWFSNIPNEIKNYTPRMYSLDIFNSSSACSYSMERVDLVTLRDLFLFIDGSTETWNGIFNSIGKLLDKMETYGRPNSFLKEVLVKTQSRINDIQISAVSAEIDNFISILSQEIDTSKFSRDCLMHGDFCFSNILYNTNTSKLVMIDPRGQLFGNHYYEIAKLSHSILYDYDIIDTELYIKNNSGDIKLYDNGKLKLKEIFKEWLASRYTAEEIYFIELLTASLFISMIPLHSHNSNNQQLFYLKFKEIVSNLNKIKN